MQGTSFGLISVMIASFLQIKVDSSSFCCLTSKTLDRKKKCRGIKNCDQTAPSKKKHLLHHERDIRSLEAELNEALAKHRAFRSERGREIHQQLILDLEARELSARADFHRVLYGRKSRAVERYQSGLLTKMAESSFRNAGLEREWKQVYGTSGPTSSNVSISGVSSSTNSQKSILEPEMEYVLGPRKKYLQCTEDVAQRLAKFKLWTDYARLKLPKEGNEAELASHILQEHSNWLLDYMKQTDIDYNKVLKFEKLPRLMQQHNYRGTYARLKRELGAEGLDWNKYASYFKKAAHD